MTPTNDEMAEVLRPIAPPRVIEGVYNDDQYARILRMIQTKGPWPTITAHHFDTVEELVATSTGVVPEGLELTLDDVATGPERICTALTKEGGVQFLTLEFAQPSFAVNDGDGYAFTVPGSDATLEVVVP